MKGIKADADIRFDVSNPSFHSLGLTLSRHIKSQFGYSHPLRDYIILSEEYSGTFKIKVSRLTTRGGDLNSGNCCQVGLKLDTGDAAGVLFFPPMIRTRIVTQNPLTAPCFSRGWGNSLFF